MQTGLEVTLAVICGLLAAAVLILLQKNAQAQIMISKLLTIVSKQKDEAAFGHQVGYNRVAELSLDETRKALEILSGLEGSLTIRELRLSDRQTREVVR